MIPIVITPSALYKTMKNPNFEIICQALHNQSTIELIVPQDFYSLFKRQYGSYGPTGAFSRGENPSRKEQALIDGLKSIIRIINVPEHALSKSSNDDNIISCIELCLQIQAFGIWVDEPKFQAKFDPRRNYKPEEKEDPISLI